MAKRTVVTLIDDVDGTEAVETVIYGEPVAFSLRDKLQTQDDPFDEHVAAIL